MSLQKRMEVVLVEKVVGEIPGDHGTTIVLTSVTSPSSGSRYRGSLRVERLRPDGEPIERFSGSPEELTQILERIPK